MNAAKGNGTKPRITPFQITTSNAVLKDAPIFDDIVVTKKKRPVRKLSSSKSTSAVVSKDVGGSKVKSSQEKTIGDPLKYNVSDPFAIMTAEPDEYGPTSEQYAGEDLKNGFKAGAAVIKKETGVDSKFKAIGTSVCTSAENGAKEGESVSEPVNAVTSNQGKAALHAQSETSQALNASEKDKDRTDDHQKDLANCATVNNEDNLNNEMRDEDILEINADIDIGTLGMDDNVLTPSHDKDTGAKVKKHKEKKKRRKKHKKSDKNGKSEKKKKRRKKDTTEDKTYVIKGQRKRKRESRSRSRKRSRSHHSSKSFNQNTSPENSHNTSRVFSNRSESPENRRSRSRSPLRRPWLAMSPNRRLASRSPSRRRSRGKSSNERIPRRRSNSPPRRPYIHSTPARLSKGDKTLGTNLRIVSEVRNESSSVRGDMRREMSRERSKSHSASPIKKSDALVVNKTESAILRNEKNGTAMPGPKTLSGSKPRREKIVRTVCLVSKQEDVDVELSNLSASNNRASLSPNQEKKLKVNNNFHNNTEKEMKSAEESQKSCNFIDLTCDGEKVSNACGDGDQVKKVKGKKKSKKNSQKKRKKKEPAKEKSVVNSIENLDDELEDLLFTTTNKDVNDEEVFDDTDVFASKPDFQANVAKTESKSYRSMASPNSTGGKLSPILKDEQNGRKLSPLRREPLVSKKQKLSSVVVVPTPHSNISNRPYETDQFSEISDNELSNQSVEPEMNDNVVSENSAIPFLSNNRDGIGDNVNENTSTRVLASNTPPVQRSTTDVSKDKKIQFSPLGEDSLYSPEEPTATKEQVCTEGSPKSSTLSLSDISTRNTIVRDAMGVVTAAEKIEGFLEKIEPPIGDLEIVDMDVSSPGNDNTGFNSGDDIIEQLHKEFVRTQQTTNVEQPSKNILGNHALWTSNKQEIPDYCATIPSLLNKVVNDPIVQAYGVNTNSKTILRDAKRQRRYKEKREKALAKLKSKPLAKDKKAIEDALDRVHRQARVENEMKQALKVYFKKKDITKDEYKKILKRAVPQVANSSHSIDPERIQSLVNKYVAKYKSIRKKSQTNQHENFTITFSP